MANIVCVLRFFWYLCKKFEHSFCPLLMRGGKACVSYKKSSSGETAPHVNFRVKLGQNGNEKQSKLNKMQKRSLFIYVHVFGD